MCIYSPFVLLYEKLTTPLTLLNGSLFLYGKNLCTHVLGFDDCVVFAWNLGGCHSLYRSHATRCHVDGGAAAKSAAACDCWRYLVLLPVILVISRKCLIVINVLLLGACSSVLAFV